MLSVQSFRKLYLFASHSIYLFLIFVHLSFVCLWLSPCVGLCTMFLLVPAKVRRDVESLELELEMVVRHHAHTKNKTWSFERVVRGLNC